MSKSNPRKAMAALLPFPLKCGDGISVAPMTLGMYAALERIGSPLVTGKEPKDTLELLPSLYLLTHDPREVFLGNVLDLAMEWAKSQPVSVVAAIREAAYRQMDAMLDVCPQVDEKKNCLRATAGSRRGLTGRRSATAGACAKSSGKSPRRQSR